MNKDQVKGRLREAKGKLKEVLGKVVGNPTDRLTGKAEQIVGKTQASFGDAKERLKKRQ
ncbi:MULTISPECIES: CsbD family protein [unclassified Burkholderia]|uniref:CsbD family protein n=1 Tax=unclassified Burkholderia TaxID=2613784 RepID=UPI000F574EB6|nr:MULTISPECIES: CsbD family protein [unclassified Burkholderia]MCR4469546.1 CsbD family protein [Burkholderia sp. SCN-KJ]RQS26172.1 CsbD family protein [Burkholderia sp. Bp8995]RQS40601.1 CsbD family protein [Burkholderia sp. Bp8989]